ncbi:MAG: hypothetical protein COV67_15650 [Nitrospinae bacterium CG11_big_fil_rev_8_21_14_0_20_56_8]|nr:MAG: hypothetical protein COV67_15650 [Nitrospinae bacterium CG11_big_fil_rev_8_21_14_0_20_56_8]
MTFQISLWTAGLFVLSLGATPAGAELVHEKSVSLEMASQAAMAAVEKCRADGYKVSAAVVDRGGNLKSLLRADGAGPHTTDSSFKKAYTANSMGRPTQDFAELAVKVPAISGLRDMNDKILILGGGLPIKFDGELAGGIGVGGAPGSQFDEACAKEGLKKIGAAVDEPKK